jgi:hypothetical protein
MIEIKPVDFFLPISALFAFGPSFFSSSAHVLHLLNKAIANETAEYITQKTQVKNGF